MSPRWPGSAPVHGLPPIQCVQCLRVIVCPVCRSCVPFLRAVPACRSRVPPVPDASLLRCGSPAKLRKVSSAGQSLTSCQSSPYLGDGVMMPTVADILALDPVRRGAPRVLAGAGRLDVPVRWVHVIELAEAGHLLRGGELVLSTGIALPPDADGLARYAAGLAAAGVSALAVELGSRYVRELPRALVSAAVVHKLPLIVLERETQFIAITEAVHAQILDAQVAELRAAQRLHRVFTDLALAGADQDEIVSQASALADAPVILADLAHRVLACAPAGQEMAPLLAGFAGRSRAAVVPGRMGYDPASGWLV